MAEPRICDGSPGLSKGVGTNQPCMTGSEVWTPCRLRE